MCFILDFLEKNVGIYQTWVLESIININSQLSAITIHNSFLLHLLHPPTPSVLGSSQDFLIFARLPRDML